MFKTTRSSEFDREQEDFADLSHFGDSGISLPDGGLDVRLAPDSTAAPKCIFGKRRLASVSPDQMPPHRLETSVFFWEKTDESG